MTLKETLAADLTVAMKARDDNSSSTLRMVLAAITNAEKAGKQEKTLTDEEIIGVLSTEAKKRREAATAFADGGRPEMAAKEQNELGVILRYLPEQLSEQEIADIVTKAIEQSGAKAEGLKAIGKVMGLVTPQVKGKADGSFVAAEVKRQLG